MASETFSRYSIVGIDFGTTFTSAGIFRDGKMHIVTNDHGNKKTPNYVAFTKDGYLVGEDAFYQAPVNVTNTIYDFKRLMGKSCNDFPRPSELEIWPFDLSLENDKKKIKIFHNGTEKYLTVEEICSMVFLKIREMCEECLGLPVTGVVLTVPVFYNASQRQAICEASRRAGMNIIHLISDPFAAAIAYGLDQKSEDSHVLVFDLGGGTFEVSVLHVSQGHMELKATSGDCHFGGEDFDSRLVSFFAQDVRRTLDKDLTGNVGALRRLRTACEHAKRALSNATYACVRVDSLADGVDLHASLLRAEFDALCEDLFAVVVHHVDTALHRAGFKPEQIDQVLMVGGGSRMPKIRELLEAYFGREIAQTVDPEEAVVIGAAIQAAALGARPIESTPLSIGIEAPGAVMTVIIPRNTTLPVRKTVNYTTYRDYQQAIALKVYEGERLLAPHNTWLGTLCLEGIPLQPRGIPQIDITFEVDVEGELTVTATERSLGHSTQMIASTGKGTITYEQAAESVREAERWRVEDERERDRVVARDLFETCLLNVKMAMSSPDVVESMEEEDLQWYTSALHEEHRWLRLNPGADREVYAKKTIDLQIMYLSVIVDVFHDDLDHEIRVRRQG